MRRRDYVGPVLCALGAACMLGGLAVDIDSGAAKGLMAAGAILFLPGAFLTLVYVRRYYGPRTVKVVAVLTGGLAVLLRPRRGRGCCETPGGGDRPRARSAREPRDRADRPGLGDAEDQGRGRDRGVVSGVREADLVLDVSLRLRAAPARGSAGGDDAKRRRRARDRQRRPGPVANGARAALFLRVHADGPPDPTARGTHILVPALRAGGRTTSAGSRRAAGIVRGAASVRCASRIAASRSAPTSRASTGPTCR